MVTPGFSVLLLNAYLLRLEESLCVTAGQDAVDTADYASFTGKNTIYI